MNAQKESNSFKLSPASLYDSGKPIPFGLYEGLIPDNSTKIYDREGLIFKNRRLERKAWLFIGIYTPEIICCMAIADAGFFTNTFAYFYSFKDNLFVEDSNLIPLGFDKYFDPDLQTVWRSGNYLFKKTGDEIHFNYNGKFKAEIKAKVFENGVSVMAPSSPSRPFVFTFKNTCISADLNLQYKTKQYAVSGKFGSIDYTKGFPPRKTKWNWCAFSGITNSGKTIGLNLVKFFNGEIENILWLEGQKIKLGNAFFMVQKPLDTQPWKMGTEDGLLNLTLFPAGNRHENTNLLVLKSKFIQVFGRIEGTLNREGKEEKFIAYGVAEFHEALW